MWLLTMFFNKVRSSTSQDCRIASYICRYCDKTTSIIKHAYSVLKKIRSLQVTAAEASVIQHLLRFRLIQRTPYLLYGFKEKISGFSILLTLLPILVETQLITTVQLMLDIQISPVGPNRICDLINSGIPGSPISLDPCKPGTTGRDAKFQ